MNYLAYSVLALVGYTLFAPMVKLASQQTPSTVVAFITNSILVLAALGVALYGREPILEHVIGPSTPYMIGAGICLAVGILAYYRALALGPVSVVVPIYGLFVVTSSIVGFAFLDETFTITKAAGIVFAALAIILVSID